MTLTNAIRALWRPTLLMILLAAVLAAPGCRKKTPEERFQEAMQLFQERQGPLAIIRMREIIQDNPDSPIIPEIRLTLANVYLEFGGRDNMSRAIEQLGLVYTALPLDDPRAIQAHQGLVELHMASDNFSEAEKQAEDAVAKAPADSRLREEAAALLHIVRISSKDDTKKAQGLADLETTMLNAEVPEVRHQARELLAMHYRQNRDFEKSNAIYQAWLDKFPEDRINPQIYAAQGLNLKLADDVEAGRPLYERGVADLRKQIEEELNLGTRTSNLNILAQFQTAWGAYDEAEATYRRIMAEQPGKMPAIQAQQAIGEMYLRAGQFDKSRALFEAMQRENAGNPIGEQAARALQVIQQIEQQRAQAGDASTSPTLAAPATPPAPAEGAATNP